MVDSGVLSSLTVVVVTYNSAAVLPLALAALPGMCSAVIVDNASSDGSAALAARLLPRAQIVPLSENIGFGRACNLALEQVHTPFALLLNPDCELQAGAVEALLAAADRYPDAALLAPRLYDAPGVLGGCYRPAFFRPQPRELLEPVGDLCSEFLTGAALLLRMEPLRRVGFFDPWFFLYGEDDDLCLRVRRAGFSLVLVHGAQAVHRAKTSAPASPQLLFRRGFCLTAAKLYLCQKHLGSAAARRQRRRALAGGSVAWLAAVARGDRRRRLAAVGRLSAAWSAPRLLASPRGDPPSD